MGTLGMPGLFPSSEQPRSQCQQGDAGDQLAEATSKIPISIPVPPGPLRCSKGKAPVAGISLLATSASWCLGQQPP